MSEWIDRCNALAVPDPFHKCRKHPATKERREHVRAMRRYKRRTRHFIKAVRKKMPLSHVANFMRRKFEVANDRKKGLIGRVLGRDKDAAK